MKIGIDISQLAYSETGVANYLKNLVQKLLETDKNNEYVLFFSSLRKTIPDLEFKKQNANVKIKTFKLPPTLLDLLWEQAAYSTNRKFYRFG